MKSEEQVAQHPGCTPALPTLGFALLHVFWPLNILGAGPHLNGRRLFPEMVLVVVSP